MRTEAAPAMSGASLSSLLPRVALSLGTRLLIAAAVPILLASALLHWVAAHEREVGARRAQARSALELVQALVVGSGSDQASRGLLSKCADLSALPSVLHLSLWGGQAADSAQAGTLQACDADGFRSRLSPPQERRLETRWHGQGLLVHVPQPAVHGEPGRQIRMLYSLSAMHKALASGERRFLLVLLAVAFTLIATVAIVSRLMIDIPVDALLTCARDARAGRTTESKTWNQREFAELAAAYGEMAADVRAKDEELRALRSALERAERSKLDAAPRRTSERAGSGPGVSTPELLEGGVRRAAQVPSRKPEQQASPPSDGLMAIDVPLGRLAQRARSLGEMTRGTDFDVVVEANGIRVPPTVLGEVWLGLNGVVQNCVVHGIEGGNERRQGGKEARGRVTLHADDTEDYLMLSVIDDGRGIDWEAIARVAERRGLPTGTRQELIDAMFTDGVTTIEGDKHQGAGLSVLGRVAESLDGWIEVDSEPDAGTTVRVVLANGAIAGLAAQVGTAG